MMMMHDPIIVGIDPAIASIGYGVIQGRKALDYGVISTPSGDPIWKRLESIRGDIKELLRTYHPSLVGIEMPFYGRENTNAAKVMQALGIIHLEVGSELEQEPTFLHQSQVKTSVARGDASKKEIQAAVMHLFNLPGLPKPDDAADGLAIAYAVQCGVTSNIR